MNHKKLSGKIALVTGSSRGIGRAVVERLSREGAAVAINYFSHFLLLGVIVANYCWGISSQLCGLFFRS